MALEFGALSFAGEGFEIIGSRFSQAVGQEGCLNEALAVGPVRIKDGLTSLLTLELDQLSFLVLPIISIGQRGFSLGDAGPANL